MQTTGDSHALPTLKLTGRQVERIALPHLEVSVLRAGFQFVTPLHDCHAHRDDPRD